MGQIALDYFNGLWERSPKLMEGRQINIRAITDLAKRYNLEDSDEYIKIKAKWEKQKNYRS